MEKDQISTLSFRSPIERKPGTLLRVLLVEDNPAQVRLTEEAFKENQIPVALTVIYDGEEALRYLKRIAHETNKPHLILLDWNLPKKNGAEILSEIKDDAKIMAIPIIIVTSSERPEDINKAYDSGVHCFIKKPETYEEFVKIIGDIEQFSTVEIKDSI